MLRNFIDTHHTAFFTSVYDLQSLFAVPYNTHGTHQSAAAARPIAGLFVHVQ